MLLFYMTLHLLTLADSVALLFLNPVFCALLGLLVMKERFGWRTGIG
jgi:drug/metabolite transporter (DMT)-like permease